MKLLVLVLNKVDKLDYLLKELVELDIYGATIIDSKGMARQLHDDLDDLPLFGSIKMLINENHPYNKTIFMVLREDKVKAVVDCVNKVIGDLSKPNVGIMFTLPIDYVEGVRD